MAARTLLLIAALIAAGDLGAQTLQPGFTVFGYDAARLRAARTQADSLAARLPPEVDVFASGAVRDVAAQKGTPSAVTGSLGLRYRGRVFVVAGLINVAAKEDTVREGFGATLLVPGAGKALNAGLLDIRAPRWPLGNVMEKCAVPGQEDKIACHVGLRAYVSASSARWATAINDAKVITAAQIVPTWGMGLGISYSFVNGVLVDTSRVALVLDVGIATRHVRGDITASDSVRQRILDGSAGKNFIGGEFALNLQYNTIAAGLTYYYMTGSVNGFSRGQVVAGVSIVSNLNSKPLKR